jgi:hypothetical protein
MDFAILVCLQSFLAVIRCLNLFIWNAVDTYINSSIIGYTMGIQSNVIVKTDVFEFNVLGKGFCSQRGYILFGWGSSPCIVQNPPIDRNPASGKAFFPSHFLPKSNLRQGFLLILSNVGGPVFLRVQPSPSRII